MNKPIRFLSYVIATWLTLAPFLLLAQRPFTPEVQQRIEKVESGLFAPIRVEGERAWTLKERMEFHKIPAVSIAVIHNYKVEWAKAYGLADAAAKIPATPQTLFQAASISKSINGVGVMKLVQEKKLNLDADINAYLTSWKFPYDDFAKGKKITLNNLLSHTAGLTVHGFPGYAQDAKIPTTIQILNGEFPANNDPVRSDSEPGVQVKYSGGGTTISQLIVSDVTGKPYDAYMKEEVLRPMGMLTSTFQAGNSITSPLATGYYANGQPIAGKFKTHPEMAAAGLWTNPTELGYYIIETQRSLIGKSSKVLSQEFTKRRLAPYMENAALGVFIRTTNGKQYFIHNGANQGFRSEYAGSMTNGNGYAIMVNSDNGAIINEIVNAIAAAYNWTDLSNSISKKPTAVAPDKLKRLEGYYHPGGGNTAQLQFSVKDGQLQLKEVWSGRTVIFRPESELEFFSTDFPYTLKFTLGPDGAATEVLAAGRDVWMKGE